MAIDKDGNLWTWGEWPILGGNTEPTFERSDICQISAGRNCAFAIDNDGNLWAWGWNDAGQLGDGTNENKNTQVQIKSDTKFAQISAGYYHTLAIDSEGNLWAWGNNANGQLGNKTEINSIVPIKIMRGHKFTQISAGYYHSMAIDSEGNLWTCGYNGYGELGNETTTSSNELIQIKNDTKFNQIFAGKYCSMAIDKSGILWAWGNNEYGQLGNGEKSAFSENFVNINEDMQFKQVAAGREHTLAIDNEDNLWAWGYNEYGLGDGNTTKSKTPIQIKSGTKFKQISSVNNYNMAIDSDDNLWAWGYNGYGNLGDGSEENKTSPVQIKSGTKFEKVVAGYHHSLAIDKAGNLWAWGRNHDGELGDGSEEDKTSPVQIKSGTQFKEISTGSSYSLAIDKEGNIWAWGRNHDGELGDGTTTSRKEPVKIKSTTKFSQVIAGKSYTSMAIDESGRLWAWGHYTYGANGRSSSEPELVTYNPKFTQISATPDSIYNDQIHYAGIDTAGNLWTWGENAYGQLGNGTTIDNSTITRVKSNCKMVVNSNDTTYVIDNTGKLFVCGENKYRLFNTSYYKSPIQITGKLNQHTVTFKDGDTVLATQTVNHGASAVAPEAPTKPGYTFAGWDKEFNNITSDLIVNAKWTASDKTPYTVEQYRQNLTLDGYDLIGSDTYEGTTGETVTAGVTGIVGFSVDENNTNNKLSGVVAADGSLVLKVYYDRGTYSVTLNTNGGAIAEGEELTRYTYGVGATLPTPTKAGYTFAGWYTNEDLTGDAIHTIGTEATGDKAYFAKWEEGTGIAYKVEHYKQNPVTNTYEKVATDDLTGKTGLSVTARPKTYEGYHENTTHADRVASGIVSADGNLVLKLYYDVNKYTVTFKNGDTVLSTQSIAHGESAVAPETPTKVGHTFTGWDKEFNNVTSDLTINAIWTVSSYKVTLNTNGGTIVTGQEVTNYTYGIGATLPTPTREGYTFAGWYRTEDLTGEAITAIGTEATGDKTYYAKWNQNQEEQPKQVGYKVEHYKQNKQANTYDKVAEDELTGTIGQTVTAQAKTYEGYTENTSHVERIASGTVSSDGSLVLKLYYDINEYKVIFKDGDKVVKEETVTHGGNATPPILTKPGYILSWDKGTDNITGEETFTAVWTKDPNYVDSNANDGKEEKPSFLPQTGESYIVVGTMSVLMSVAVLLYLKYRKLNNM